MIDLRKYNEATTLLLPVIVAGAVDFAASGDWTPAAGDVKIIKNEGTPANIGTLPTAVGSMWKFTLTAAELSAARVVIQVVDSATKAVEDQGYLINTFGHASAQYETFPSDVTKISGDSTAADNLELQYDTTGLSGDTFPSTQLQIGQIGIGSASVSTVAASATITTGTETLTYTATIPLDGTTHDLAPSGGTLDFYYEFSVGPGATASLIDWHGYVNSNGDDLEVYGWNWVTSAWVQIGSMNGSPGSTIAPESWNLISAMTGTGANAGTVRLRFYSTGGSVVTKLATDQVLCSYAVTSQSVGYANGAIWVDTNHSNTNTTDYVDGTADNPVSTWAAALTLSASLGIERFHIVNGSSITLTGTSDNYALGGASWFLDFGGQAINGACITGAIISGVGTAAVTSPHFEQCAFGTVTLPPSRSIDCGFGYGSGVMTAGSDGQYVFNNCRSLVPGSGSPSFDFSGLGAATGINNRAWCGGVSFTLDSDCTLSHEVLAGGGTTITTGGGDVEIRGITRSLTVTMSAAETVQFVGTTGPITLSGTTTGTVNLYGVSASLTDTTSAATVTDKTVSQDNVSTFDPAADTVAHVTLVDTVTTNTDVTALNDISVADILAGVIDGTTDLQEVMNRMNAFVRGLTNGAGSGSIEFLEEDDATIAFTLTVDANGERS